MKLSSKSITGKGGKKSLLPVSGEKSFVLSHQGCGGKRAATSFAAIKRQKRKKP